MTRVQSSEHHRIISDAERLGPAGLPKPIVDKAWRDTAALLKTAEVRERFASLGADPIGSTPDEFTAFIKTEIAKWEKVIRGANIQVD